MKHQHSAMRRCALAAISSMAIGSLAPTNAFASNGERSMQLFSGFLRAFPPDATTAAFAGELGSNVESHAHPLLIAFWRTVGFGSFGNGFLHFYHPSDYAETLAEWLGSKSVLPDKVPFARTAFGDLIYFRDLRENARRSGLPTIFDLASDIGFLSVHRRRTEVIAYKMQDFFDTELSAYLKRSELPMYTLYHDLRRTRPKPSSNTCYFFVPALMLGGKPDLAHIESGDCQVHLNLLHQLGT